MRIGSRGLVVMGCLAMTCHAAASGYYNMPTNLRQCLGVGFGPGYHAPLLLGPWWKSRTASQRVKHLPNALAPPRHSGFAEPTVLGHSHTDHIFPAHGYPSHGYGVSQGGVYGPVIETYAAPPRAPQPIAQPSFAPPPTMVGGPEVVPAPEPAR